MAHNQNTPPTLESLQIEIDEMLEVIEANTLGPSVIEVATRLLKRAEERKKVLLEKNSRVNIALQALQTCTDPKRASYLREAYRDLQKIVI